MKVKYTDTWFCRKLVYRYLKYNLNMNGKTEKEKDNFKKEFEKVMPSDFLKFLKDNNILEKYVNNIANILSVLYPNMLTFLKPEDYVAGVFAWYKTPKNEGVNYWSRYDIMWRKYLEQNTEIKPS